ncbi:MAG: ribbon-helix-helix protein, CopG family [Steroidobacteraceae bacterium]
MSALNVRVTSETAAFLERVARQTGRTKSEVVRQALEALRRKATGTSTTPPAKALAHLIGCWDSGGLRLSERTGSQFARILREKRQNADAQRVGRRRPARRTD